MKQVILGEDTETGRALRLDLDMLVRTRLLIQANSGGGKSWTIRRLLEQSHGRVQQIVLDPEGEFATLREKYDYVLVGKGGDVATDARHAPKLAERLMELGASAIIDLYELKPADRRHYVAVFLSALVNLPKHLWHPCLVVVDEAHVYCMDEETEILTPIGWKRWDGVKPGDLAVAFDLETGGFRNEPVLRVITKRHTGEMVRLRSDGIDSLVTSDHRVVLHRIQRGVGRYGIYLPVFCRASDIPTHVYIPIGGAPVGPGVEGLTLDMARIVGWVISDGYRSATKKDGRGMVEELRVLLPAGVATYPRERRNRSQSVVFYFGADFSRDVLRWLEDGLHRIPRRILADGSPAQLRALYFGLLEGDGTATVGGWRAFYPGKDEALADDFQELATRLGISAVKKYVPQTGQWTVLLSHRKRHYIRRPERQAYEGLVWDITIPSGAFVARRHGKVFVTGNCPERGVGESESLDAVIDLTTRGRKRGYASVLATQRISKSTRTPRRNAGTD